MIDKILHKIYDFILSLDKSYGVKKFTQKKTLHIQEKLLINLIRKSKNTLFGKNHDFHKIKNYQDFKSRVPIRDYEKFKNYIEKIRKGKKNILWPGKPLYFAKTSGTTSGEKFIPISKESIKNQINSAGYLLFDYINQKKSLNLTRGKAMFLSGSPNLKKRNGIRMGRLSGIVNHHQPFYLKNMLLPTDKTNMIENWEEKIDKIAEETMGKDLKVI